jgi:hypothetical protein
MGSIDTFILKEGAFHGVNKELSVTRERFIWVYQLPN